MKNIKILLFAFTISMAMQSCSDDDTNFEFCTAEAETGTITVISNEEAHVYTSIVIDATPNQVWSVLTDFENYSSWSTSFLGLEGEIRDGGMVNAIFPLPNGQNFPFPHTLSYTEGVSFGWSDPILTFPGIVDNHFYSIETCGDKTLLIQTDEFTGNDENAPAIGLANALLPNYQLFNNELKTEVEKRF